MSLQVSYLVKPDQTEQNRNVEAPGRGQIFRSPGGCMRDDSGGCGEKAAPDFRTGRKSRLKCCELGFLSIDTLDDHHLKTILKAEAFPFPNVSLYLPRCQNLHTSQSF